MPMLSRYHTTKLLIVAIFFLLLITPTGSLSVVIGQSAEPQPDNRGTKPIVVENRKGKTVQTYDESHALVIGVSRYENDFWGPLPGVEDDVKAVSEELAKQGFAVKVVMNPTRTKFRDEMDEFIAGPGSKKNNRLLIYFAGHGYTLPA